jgi:hypothetical protein
MTTASSVFLDQLKTAADAAVKAEEDFRRSIAPRAKALETERAFAFRRLNLMRAVAESVRAAETEEAALAASEMRLRDRLGWVSESAARSEVLARFAPIATAIFAESASGGLEPKPKDVAKALAEFEAWYAATHPVPFWALFENVMPETPVVDF